MEKRKRLVSALSVLLLMIVMHSNVLPEVDKKEKKCVFNEIRKYLLHTVKDPQYIDSMLPKGLLHVYKYFSPGLPYPLEGRLYKVTFSFNRPSTEYLVLKDNTSKCFVLGGDLRDNAISDIVLGSLWWEYSESQINDAIITFPPRQRSKREIIEYVKGMFDLHYWNYEQIRRIIASADDLWRGTDRSKFPMRADLSEEIKAQIVPPEINQITENLYSGSFFIWHELGGILEQAFFLYWTDGRVIIKPDKITYNVGPSNCGIYRPELNVVDAAAPLDLKQK